jgi:hypothetical protein
MRSRISADFELFTSSFLAMFPREVQLAMASVLLLRGAESAVGDRHPLRPAEEDALAPAFRELVSFATPPEQGALALERDGDIVAGWTREGALRLAQLLPPAFEELASAIRARHE